MNLSGKRVVVVGLGASGVAAARLCQKRGAITIGLDSKPEASPQARALEVEGVTLALGSNSATDLTKADLIVVSPGVPTFDELARAEKMGVPAIGEVELATACLTHEAPIVAIGGTNGKSTTTTLVAELLQAARKKVFVGGNLGEPLASHADERFDVIVLEVSSFQMERVRNFHPRVAVLLNITDDHLDRYSSFEDYAHAKGNCFVRQTSRDLAVVPFGDSVCTLQARRGQAEIVTFGPGGDCTIDPSALRIRGSHNALNAAAAVAAIAPFGVSSDEIASVLASFEGLAHRMTLVTTRDGVAFYDDSKGTNVGAAVTAVLGVTEPRVVLIAGGRDKGGSYDPLVAALRKKGRALVVIGEASDAISSAVNGELPVVRATTIDDAVAKAADLAQRGDAVLLSPACSSFDMFRDYKHRGDEFARAVRALAGGK